MQAAGQAWVLGPEDRSNTETEIPNHVEIESIEPRLTLMNVPFSFSASRDYTDYCQTPLEKNIINHIQDL